MAVTLCRKCRRHLSPRHPVAGAVKRMHYQSMPETSRSRVTLMQHQGSCDDAACSSESWQDVEDLELREGRERH